MGLLAMTRRGFLFAKRRIVHSTTLRGVTTSPSAPMASSSTAGRASPPGARRRRAGFEAFMRAAPTVAPLLLDLYARAQDWPFAQDVAERVEAMLPPPVKAV